MSCASCHQPDRAFTDGRALAEGLEQRRGTRNTPTVVNAALQAAQFWDGRRASLDEQVLDPFLNPLEHGLPNRAFLVEVIRKSGAYRAQFKAAFGADAGRISAEQIAHALASFIRSLTAGDSPFDRYVYGCDRSALNEAARRGLALFEGRAQCNVCHLIGDRYSTFNDERYHSVGVGLDRVAPRLAALTRRVVSAPRAEIDLLIVSDPEVAALGRFAVTREPADIGKFRTPSLRNVALTAPYMHDGSVTTLEEAVNHELYYRGQSLGRPLILTPSEREDLVSFLRSLTSFDLPR